MERFGNDIIKFYVWLFKFGNYKFNLFIYVIGEKKEWL